MTPDIPIHDRMYQAVAAWIERYTRTRYWQIRVVALSLLVCFAASFPDYHQYVVSSKDPQTWQVVKQQIKSPFTALPASELPPPASNEAKRVYRLFMPVLGHLLHVERAGVLAVQNLMGVLFLWVTLMLAYKVTADRIAATFFVLGVALTFTSICFFNSFSTNLDGPGYLLLTASLLAPDIFSLFLLLFLASFVDERVFACFGFVILWWKLSANKPDAWTWRRIFAIDRYVLAVASAMLLHGVIRYYLTVSRGFHLPLGDFNGVGFGTIRQSWKVLSPSIIAPFEGLSLFVVLALIVLTARCRWSVLWCTAAVTSALLAQSFSVWDHTRSLAYGFPLIILSLKILKELDTNLDVRKMAALTCSLCLLIPTFHVTGDRVGWYTPILPRVLGWFF